ncbi:WNT inhibitory factor 1 isoform X14 [Rhipicephalus microplus]|uniref:WNT inhibitory factor 1 isoform X14 n=1 Tax=Rhipicephalus microplus TaxID=6941 RepID=UPI003F6CC695
MFAQLEACSAAAVAIRRRDVRSVSCCHPRRDGRERRRRAGRARASRVSAAQHGAARGGGGGGGAPGGSRRGTRKASERRLLPLDRRETRFPMEIFAILDGVVLPYILDPNFERYLPVIPSGVNSVNFTWKAGENKHYYYDFDMLQSFDSSILKDPVISIDTKGKVPRKAKVFQVFLPCWGNVTGMASFGIGLRIENDKGRYLSGTPLRLRLQKQCADNRPDPECDRKCANGGRCNAEKICECPKRYMGRYCRTACAQCEKERADCECNRTSDLGLPSSAVLSTVHERRNVCGSGSVRLRHRIPGTALRRSSLNLPPYITP